MKKLLVIIFVSILTVSSNAQYGSIGTVDARSLGMGKTYTSNSRGVNAIGINPANLIFSDEGSIDFSLLLPAPSLSLRGGTDFLSFDDLNYFFGGVNGSGRVLNEDDKQRLNSLFQQGGLVFVNISANLISGSINAGKDIGSFGISVTDFAGGKLQVPQALVDLALNGNPTEKVFNLNDAFVQSWWLRSYSISYARDISGLFTQIFNKFGAGVSLKYYQGFFNFQTENINTEIVTGDKNVITGSADFLAYSAFSRSFGVRYKFEPEAASSNFGLFPTPAGNGFAFDFGLSASIKNDWTIGLAVTDIGSMNWNDHTAKFVSDGEIFLDDISNKDQIDSVKEKLTGEAVPIGGYSTGLPTALRFGISKYFSNDEDFIPGNLLLAFDYNQGFNDLPGNTKNPRFAIGTEWKPGNWIPYIRTGLTYSSLIGLNWTFGLGFYTDIFEFNLATNEFQSYLIPNAVSHTSVAISSRWRIN